MGEVWSFMGELTVLALLIMATMGGVEVVKEVEEVEEVEVVKVVELVEEVEGVGVVEGWTPFGLAGIVGVGVGVVFFVVECKKGHLGPFLQYPAAWNLHGKLGSYTSGSPWGALGSCENLQPFPAEHLPSL
jgi:hypothetical protein